jgi:hypothetical protein
MFAEHLSKMCGLAIPSCEDQRSWDTCCSFSRSDWGARQPEQAQHPKGWCVLRNFVRQLTKPVLLTKPNPTKQSCWGGQRALLTSLCPMEGCLDTKYLSQVCRQWDHVVLYVGLLEVSVPAMKAIEAEIAVGMLSSGTNRDDLVRVIYRKLHATFLN